MQKYIASLILCDCGRFTTVDLLYYVVDTTASEWRYDVEPLIPRKGFSYSFDCKTPHDRTSILNKIRHCALRWTGSLPEDRGFMQQLRNPFWGVCRNHIKMIQNAGFIPQIF